MEIREMRKTDIAYVIPIYLDYYNNCEDGCWTIEKAQRRINQVVCMEDAYSLILENKGNVIGFAMGYFKQYDDIIGYTLEEILIASPYQHQGIGSWLLNELEHKVSEKAHLYWNYWLLTMICMNITMEKLIIIRRQILFQEQSDCNKFRFE